MPTSGPRRSPTRSRAPACRNNRREDDEPGEDDDEPEDEVWQVTDSSNTVVRASQSLSQPLPTEDTDEATLAGSRPRATSS